MHLWGFFFLNVWSYLTIVAQMSLLEFPAQCPVLSSSLGSIRRRQTVARDREAAGSGCTCPGCLAVNHAGKALET